LAIYLFFIVCCFFLSKAMQAAGDAINFISCLSEVRYPKKSFVSYTDEYLYYYGKTTHRMRKQLYKVNEILLIPPKKKGKKNILII